MIRTHIAMQCPTHENAPIDRHRTEELPAWTRDKIT